MSEQRPKIKADLTRSTILFSVFFFFSFGEVRGERKYYRIGISLSMVTFILERLARVTILYQEFLLVCLTEYKLLPTFQRISKFYRITALLKILV